MMVRHVQPPWEKSFPTSENVSRPEVTVRVARDSTCETVCEEIASKLDVAEARVVLLDKRRGGARPVVVSILSTTLA